MKRFRMRPFSLRCTVVLAAALAAAWPGSASADVRALLVLLPEERADAFEAALRLELAGQPFALFARTVPAGHAPTSDEARHAANSQPADIVLWVDTSSGPLVPPVLRSLVVADDAERGARLPDALDVQDAAVFATIASSLLDAAPQVLHAELRDEQPPDDALLPVAEPGPVEGAAGASEEAAAAPQQEEPSTLGFGLQLGAGLLEGDAVIVVGLGLGLFQTGALAGGAALRLVSKLSDPGRGDVFLLNPLTLALRSDLSAVWIYETRVGLLAALSAESAGLGYSLTARLGLDVGGGVYASLSLGAEQWFPFNGGSRRLLSSTIGCEARF